MIQLGGLGPPPSRPELTAPVDGQEAVNIGKSTAMPDLIVLNIRPGAKNGAKKDRQYEPRGS